MNLHITSSMRVGVTLWFGWGGVVSGCRLKHYRSVHVECDIKLVSLSSTIKMLRGPINKRSYVYNIWQHSFN